MSEDFIPHKDLALIKKCIKHDEAAIREFMKLYKYYIHAVIRTRLSHNEQHYFDDICQEMISYIFSGNVLPNYMGKSRFSTYLWRVLVRQLKKSLKKWKTDEIEINSKLDLISKPEKNEMDADVKEVLAEMKKWNEKKTTLFEINKKYKTSYRQLEILYSIPKTNIGRDITSATKKFKELFNKKKPGFFEDV